MDKDTLDLLKKVEDLTSKTNELFRERTRSVFSRYPLTFALLIVFGVTMVTEGAKQILAQVGFLAGKPWFMLAFGIAVLVFTGTLYKRLGR